MDRIRLGIAAPCCALAWMLAACEAGDKSKAENASTGPSLRIVSPRMDQVISYDDAVDETTKQPKGADVQAMFDLRDYVVSQAKPQEGAANPYAAGSGQHVHLIVDDEPYAAIYDVSKGVPIDKKDAKGQWVGKRLMTEGTHVIRAFPSAGPNDEKGARWHESRKNPGAFAWVRFHVKAKGKSEWQAFDADKSPTLTYSRPKGEYALGKPDSPLLFPLLLDFYVTGCTLSSDGYRVQATVDGKAMPAITEWKADYAWHAPYSLPTDLGAGDHTVVLELQDKDGKPVPGLFNHTERKISLK